MANTDETKGRMKEAAGALTDNPTLKRKGQDDRIKGKAKKHVDRAADAIKDKL